MVKTGDKIYLEPESEVYKGRYASKVLKAEKDYLVISIPYYEGKLIPLAVGTKVKVEVDSGFFNSEIISRKFGENKNLVIAGSESIFRGQRTKPNESIDSQKTKVIAVTSGKGGVGKSTLSINLAICLAELGKKVCIFDADLGMANIDVLLNLSPQYNLSHLINGSKDIFDIVVEGPKGILIIPGGSGWREVANLRDSEFSKLLQAFNRLDEYTDIILLDTGAGINQNVINFLLASDEVLLITIPEPHAITDAYAMIKVINRENYELPINIIVNKAEDQKEGKQVGDKIATASKQFLQAPVKYIGHVEDSVTLVQSVKNQVPIVVEKPRSIPAENIMDLANRLIGAEETSQKGSGLKGFVKKLSRFLVRK